MLAGCGEYFSAAANECNARFYPLFAPLSVREVGADTQLSDLLFAPPCRRGDGKLFQEEKQKLGSTRVLNNINLTLKWRHLSLTGSLMSERKRRQIHHGSISMLRSLRFVNLLDLHLTDKLETQLEVKSMYYILHYIFLDVLQC